ncbi:hypothetical protein D9M70_523890 [compost metagenome]
MAQGRLRVGQVELLLGFRLVELGVDMLQHADEQLLLVAEVVIDHPVVGLGQLGYLFDAPAGITLLAEDLHRCLQDAATRLVCLLRTCSVFLAGHGLPGKAMGWLDGGTI